MFRPRLPERVDGALRTRRVQAQTNFRRWDHHKIYWMQRSKEFTLGSAKIASVMQKPMPR
ncbi:MAG: hypothetical protein JWO19_6153 [Bryobacterales bacterium]|nr:hypothetical protein [Bryobacterales bacterium]